MTSQVVITLTTLKLEVLVLLNFSPHIIMQYSTVQCSTVQYSTTNSVNFTAPALGHSKQDTKYKCQVVEMNTVESKNVEQTKCTWGCSTKSVIP